VAGPETWRSTEEDSQTAAWNLTARRYALTDPTCRWFASNRTGNPACRLAGLGGSFSLQTPQHRGQTASLTGAGGTARGASALKYQD
jgi:hypothetical protein